MLARLCLYRENTNELQSALLCGLLVKYSRSLQCRQEAGSFPDRPGPSSSLAAVSAVIRMSDACNFAFPNFLTKQGDFSDDQRRSGDRDLLSASLSSFDTGFASSISPSRVRSRNGAHLPQVHADRLVGLVAKSCARSTSANSSPSSSFLSNSSFGSSRISTPSRSKSASG